MRNLRHSVTLFVLQLSVAAVGMGDQPVPQSGEFQVNAYSTGNQRSPAVASTDAGTFVVVWSSTNGGGSGQDGSGLGVIGRLFGISGQALTSDLIVNTYTTGSQLGGIVSETEGGRFVVAWHSSLQDGNMDGVFAQRYEADGMREALEFKVNAYTTQTQAQPSVAPLNEDGDFLVAWTSEGQDGSGGGVFARDYVGGVAGSEQQVNEFTVSDQDAVSAASDRNGSVVLTWTSATQDGDQRGVEGRVYDSAGLPVTGEFQVNTFTPGLQYDASVAINSQGRFLIVWTSSQDGSGQSVHGQLYESDGSLVNTEFQVNTQTSGSQRNARTAADATDGFVVVWEGPAEGNLGIRGQRLDVDGQVLGSEFAVNEFTGGSQTNSAVAADSTGRILVVWQSDAEQDGSEDSVHGRVFLLPEIVGIFADGFESGDLSAWSGSSP